MVCALEFASHIRMCSLDMIRVAGCEVAVMFCSSWTNKLITAKDHGSIQINVGHLDESGVYDGTQTTFALRGKVRANVRL